MTCPNETIDVEQAEDEPRTSPRRRGAEGGLEICGCIWRVASDDFVLSSSIEFFTRFIGLATVVGVFIFSEVASFTCASDFHLNVYLLVAIVVFTASMVNLVFLGLESSRGSIWDENPQIRSRVVPLLYVNLILTIFEFLWALTGTIWVIHGLLRSCKAPGPVGFTDGPLYAILAVIVTTWIGLVLKILGLCFSYSDTSCKDSNSGNNETFIKSSSKSCFKALSGVCIKPSNIDLFNEVANVLEEVFDDSSFVPTDIAAALILLYAKQRTALVQNNSLSLSRQSSPGPSGIHDESGIMAEIKYYISYACASYGYTWYLMNKRPCRSLWKMYPYMTCCGALCACRNDPGLIIEADNCLRCNTAALRATLPHLKSDNIVHISFKNNLMKVPFFVAVDEDKKAIVISIRGTLSLEDTLTDLCAKPQSMESHCEGMADFSAHTGMYKAAQYVLSELREKNILNNTLAYYDDFDIVVTGHSLGAGTAAILAMMLRRLHPRTRCFAYSPPGGLFNEAAAQESEKFTYSVIVGNDLVPRLSLQSLKRLKHTMTKELKSCKLPKFQILGSGICACFCTNWHEQLVDADELINNRERADSEDSCDSSEPIMKAAVPLYGCEEGGETQSKYPTLLLPGKIFHFEPNVGEEGTTYHFSIKTSLDFREILVSPKMLTDHFPITLRDILNNQF